MVMFCIVFGGEMIFSLPFHLTRFFRPTMLDVFSLSNTQLGDIFALYGIMAMASYFLGGPIADRFSGRRLMTFSLLSTALGGIYFAQIPDVTGLNMLFAFWGITTIFLFWASMIKVTREWGGTLSQGKAFGILDGGRGLVAAFIATLAVFLLSQLLPTDIANLSNEQRTSALQSVIYFYTVLTVFAAFLVWYFVPDTSTDSYVSKTHERDESVIHLIWGVIRQPVIWCQAGIVLCAYSGYKALDQYALYATDVLKFNELEAAWLVSTAAFLRPIAAIMAGVLADRYGVTRVIASSFVVLTLSYLFFAQQSGATFSYTLIYANFLLSFFMVFAIRAIYFALLEETKVAGYLTGTSVGIVSIVGFTPDIFFGPISGRILDASPGAEGFNQFFLLMALIGLTGLLISTLLMKKIRQPL
jgi:MFS family permease